MTMEQVCEVGYGYTGEQYTDTILNNGSPIYNVTFTVNNYNEKHVEFFKQQNYKYLIMYSEEGKRNHTPHIQGFISFDMKKKKRLATLQNQLKKFAGSACWMRPSKGTAVDNKLYCEKEGTCIFEGGNIKLCGRGTHERTLLDTQALIDSGVSIEDIARDNYQLYIQYGKRLEAYRDLISNKDRDEYTQGIYIHGDTGQGKTTNFMKKMKEFGKWNKLDFVEYDGKYYDNYNGKEIAVFDDNFTLEEKDILNLINIKPWRMRMLGRYKSFSAKFVVIIDNLSIDERFGTRLNVGGEVKVVSGAPERIKRRFKEINYDTVEGKLEFDKLLEQDL